MAERLVVAALPVGAFCISSQVEQGAVDMILVRHRRRGCDAQHGFVTLTQHDPGFWVQAGEGRAAELLKMHDAAIGGLKLSGSKTSQRDKADSRLGSEESVDGFGDEAVEDHVLGFRCSVRGGREMARDAPMKRARISMLAAAGTSVVLKTWTAEPYIANQGTASACDVLYVS